MKRRIAIVTGASGGMGKEFTKLMLQEDLDEIWTIARNKEKLLGLKEEFGEKIVTISKDLTKISELYSIEEMLKEEEVVVAYLVNNAGVAKMGSYKDFTIKEIEDAVSINCSLMPILCNICIPYMEGGSKILNISSASAFQPLPYINLYASSKAFERSYSRSLNLELKGTGITSTAVCPSWVDTELLTKEINGEKVKFPGIVPADKVAIKALKDAKKGKDMSVCTLYVKWMHLLAKIFPQKIVMDTWMRKIKKYV